MIRTARRDSREARGNEEREKRGLRKGAERELRKEKETKRQFEEKAGLRAPPILELSRSGLRCSHSHCFFKSSGYYKLELKHQNLVFSSL